MIDTINAQWFKQVKAEDGCIQIDALVDCGNALSQLAEVSEPVEVEAILQASLEAYKCSLSRSQDASVRLSI